MNTPKKPAVRNILFIVAAVCVVAVVAIALRSNRPEKIAPQAADPQTSGAASQAGNAGERHAAGTSPGIAATTSTSPLRPRATQPVHQPRALAPTAASAISADTPASFTPRQRSTFEKIPASRLRDELLQLTPEARALALRILATKRIPKADFACLHVSSGGHLYYACRFLASGAATEISNAASDASDPTEAAAAVPINQPPVRHSRPGATKILFLDFGGGDIAGTAWNEATEDRPAVALYRALPYNVEGEPTTFSDQEQKNIVEIWERISEYYSAFDVDVTTEKPAVFTRTTGRALITRSTDATGQNMPAVGGPDGSADGVAYLQAFGWLDYETTLSPAFIYYDRLNSNNADIAYATAHELGHNLGLSHDGPGYGTDDDDFGYYSGHGSGAISWAPIMGNGYNFNRRSVNQWSKGEYYRANNKEDDLMILEGKFGYRQELTSVTLANATPITLDNDGRLTVAGIIRNASFAHYYAFDRPPPDTINVSVIGNADFDLKPCRLSHILGSGSLIGSTDLRLDILDSNGNIKSASYPNNQTSAFISTQLTAGRWYLRVTSEGAGNPMASTPTGYTPYGSIGQYTLTISNMASSTPIPIAPSLNSNLTWTTEPGGDAGWFGQIFTTHDGIAAAQNDPISQGQSAGIVTTVEGTGTISFWWKISANSSDYLTFANTDEDGTTSTLASINGYQYDWQQCTIPITSTGTHRFGWIFDKAPNDNPLPNYGGSAWVDQVTWTPTVPFNITPSTIEATSGLDQFAIAVETDKTWTTTTGNSWLTVSSTSGAGNTTLTITHETNDTSTPRRGTVTITSGGINRTCEIVQPAHIPFSAALDNNLTWTTGGDNTWTTQTLTTHDNKHAARSGIILGTSSTTSDIGQNTWLQTTVTGPGVINFWWKVSSEEEESDEDGDPWGDILYFKVNEVERARTSGEKDWAQRSFTITGTGVQTLKWLYQKDPYLDVGGDAAWLDQVTWTSGTDITLNVSPDTRQVAAASGRLTVTVDTNIAWTAVSSASWLTISPSGGASTGTINATYAVNTSTNSRTGTITVRAGNLIDTCIVTQAGGTGGTNNNNNNSGGGGGGGAPSPWSLLALGLLFVARKIPRRD